MTMTFFLIPIFQKTKLKTGKQSGNTIQAEGGKARAHCPEKTLAEVLDANLRSKFTS
jgi:hypothetical protein